MIALILGNQHRHGMIPTSCIVRNQTTLFRVFPISPTDLSLLPTYRCLVCW